MKTSTESRSKTVKRGGLFLHEVAGRIQHQIAETHASRIARDVIFPYFVGRHRQTRADTKENQHWRHTTPPITGTSPSMRSTGSGGGERTDIFEKPLNRRCWSRSASASSVTIRRFVNTGSQLELPAWCLFVAGEWSSTFAPDGADVK